MSQVNKLGLRINEIKHIHEQFKVRLDEKLTLHLPEAEETIKQQIRLEIEKFIVNVMEMAGKSIDLIDAKHGTTVKDIITDVQQEYVEPFDLNLNEQVRKLYQEWEDETVNVSQLRRNGPDLIRQKYLTQGKTVLDDIDERISILESNQNTYNLESEEQKNEEANSSEFTLLFEEYETSLLELSQAQNLLPHSRFKHETLKKLIKYLDQEISMGLT